MKLCANNAWNTIAIRYLLIYCLYYQHILGILGPTKNINALRNAVILSFIYLISKIIKNWAVSGTFKDGQTMNRQRTDKQTMGGQCWSLGTPLGSTIVRKQDTLRVSLFYSRGNKQVRLAPSWQKEGPLFVISNPLS